MSYRITKNSSSVLKSQIVPCVVNQVPDNLYEQSRVVELQESAIHFVYMSVKYTLVLSTGK